MDETRLRQAAEAIAEVKLFDKHQIGEIEVMTVRTLLEDVSRLGDTIPVEDKLLEIARTAIAAYQQEPDRGKS